MASLDWKLLTAFEAVARHRNFSRAAAELNVQQPAVSRRVAALEASLGITLLHRTRPHATLTPEGEILFRGLVDGFEQVRTALDQVRRHAQRNVVTVNTTIGFASCYLMKRLPAFRAAHPEISVELVSRDQNESYGVDNADLVIVFDAPDRLPGIRHARIFSEVLVAAARPGFVQDLPDDPTALADRPLLHLTSGLHGDDWRTFLAGTGIVANAPRSDLRFTSFMVYLHAALNGEGIMLGWETLLQDHFDLGQLVRITGRRVHTDRGYFVCMTARADTDRSARLFMDWLAGLE